MSWRIQCFEMFIEHGNFVFSCFVYNSICINSSKATSRDGEVGLPDPGWETPVDLVVEPREDRDLSGV